MHRFSRFSTWTSLNRAMLCLRHVTHTYKKALTTETCHHKGWHYCQQIHTNSELMQSRNTIIREVQEECYTQDIPHIKNHTESPKNNMLEKLNLFIDEDGLLCIGSRIKQAKIKNNKKHPIIIPSKHHIATLLIKHYYEQTQHQGYLFTEGAIHTAGFWIVGDKKHVSTTIYHCFKCRRLCSLTQIQKMANLPTDHFCMEPSFTNVWTYLAPGPSFHIGPKEA